jgi:hypothetical protein
MAWSCETQNWFKKYFKGQPQFSINSRNHINTIFFLYYKENEFIYNDDDIENIVVYEMDQTFNINQSHTQIKIFKKKLLKFKHLEIKRVGDSFYWVQNPNNIIDVEVYLSMNGLFVFKMNGKYSINDNYYRIRDLTLGQELLIIPRVLFNDIIDFVNSQSNNYCIDDYYTDDFMNILFDKFNNDIIEEYFKNYHYSKMNNNEVTLLKKEFNKLKEQNNKQLELINQLLEKTKELKDNAQNERIDQQNELISKLMDEIYELKNKN